MLKISNERSIAFHPGYYVKRYLDSQGMTQRELADRLNTTEKNVSELVNGKVLLNRGLIDGLALALGTSTDLWNNLNETYLNALAQIQRDEQFAAEAAVLNQMDYAFWEALGMVKVTDVAAQRIGELKRYLRIANLAVLKKRNFLVQYQTTVVPVKMRNVINANAWVQTALNVASDQALAPVNLKYLKSALPTLKQLTRQQPHQFMPKLDHIFRQAGIAFVVLPNLKNCGINGAVKWLGKDKVLLAINNQQPSADTFWVALFHEIRHVFQRKRGHMLVSTSTGHGLRTTLDAAELERDADRFAQDYLLAPAAYQAFTANRDFSRAAVQQFAAKLGIHPGIVVARLQRDQYVHSGQLADLREKYTIGLNPQISFTENERPK